MTLFSCESGRICYITTDTAYIVDNLHVFHDRQDETDNRLPTPCNDVHAAKGYGYYKGVFRHPLHEDPVKVTIQIKPLCMEYQSECRNIKNQGADFEG